MELPLPTGSTLASRVTGLPTAQREDVHQQERHAAGRMTQHRHTLCPHAGHRPLMLSPWVRPMMAVSSASERGQRRGPTLPARTRAPVSAAPTRGAEPRGQEVRSGSGAHGTGGSSPRRSRSGAGRSSSLTQDPALHPIDAPSSCTRQRPASGTPRRASRKGVETPWALSTPLSSTRHVAALG